MIATKFFRTLAQMTMTGLLLTVAGSAAAQQPYPTKPVRMVVPYAPGGSTSALAQLVAKQLGDLWGHQVLVDHRSGGNTVIGSDHVAKSAPDGYTLMMTSNAHVVIPQLVATPFDPIKDFVPIAAVSSTELVLVVHPAVQANTLQEFIALAKSRPGSIDYASAGSSSATHLAGELLNTLAGIKLQHVPYKGSGPAISDLLGGHVQASFQTPIVAIPYIRSGKLKALAVSGDNRLAAVPQIPTFTEAGLAGFNAATWFGVVAPAETPRPIVEKVAQDIRKILATPEFTERLGSLGLDPFYKTPAQFADLMKSDMARFARIIKTSNIKLD